MYIAISYTTWFIPPCEYLSELVIYEQMVADMPDGKCNYFERYISYWPETHSLKCVFDYAVYTQAHAHTAPF